MDTDELYGWRDSAIALAALGAAAVSRSAFATLDDADPSPLQMQVLVALAVQDSMLAEARPRTGTAWLSIALRIEQEIVDQLVARLVARDLAAIRRDADDEIMWELGGDEDENVVAGELPIVLTEHGRAAVERWFLRVRWQFGGWPAVDPGVDDAID